MTCPLKRCNFCTNSVDNFVDSPRYKPRSVNRGAAWHTLPAKEAGGPMGGQRERLNKPGKSAMCANKACAPASLRDWADWCAVAGQYAHTVAPAATPAVMPGTESSMTKQRSGGAFKWRAAAK